MAISEIERRKQQELIINYNVRFHLRALNLCGIWPPENVSSDPWKLRLFNIYTYFTLMWFIPAITSMCIELRDYLDSLEKAIPIIFQISAFVLSAILAAYFVYRRKIMMNLFNTLETNFRPYMEMVRSSTKKLKSLEESMFFGKLIADMFLYCAYITVFIWVIIPCIKGYVEYIWQFNQEDIERNRGKYFGLTMWFPSNVNKSPIYETAQILHGITVFTGVLNITGWYMAMLALIYHTSSHFSMLVDLIDDIGIRFSTKQLSHQRQCANTDQLRIEDKPIDADSEFSQYLVRCVEYHQEIINFSYEIETFLRPMLLIIFVFSEVLMCLSTFRLAHGHADDESLKFLMSGSFFYVWLLAFCWAGDKLTEQSLAVERAIYNCPWHQHMKAARDIRFITMRAQKPVRLTAGKFYNLSLETYLQIANTVYAYYTLLKNVADS